jgi:hypothetical protein
MQALVEYEKGVCSGCGVHHSLIEDDEFYWTFDERFCAMCASAAQHGRAQAAIDRKRIEELGDDPDPLTPLPDDGRTTMIRELTPAEAMRQKTRRRESGQ